MYSIKTAPKKVLLSSLHILMRELSNDDDEGSENVAKKMNLRSFKLIAYIWIRSVCQMEAIFPEVEFSRNLSRFIKRKGNSSCYVHVLYKTSHRRIHVVAVQWTSKEYTRSMMHVQSYCFAHKTNCLLTLSSASWSR